MDTPTSHASIDHYFVLPFLSIISNNLNNLHVNPLPIISVNRVCLNSLPIISVNRVCLNSLPIIFVDLSLFQPFS